VKIAINKDEWSPVYFIHTDAAGLEFLPTFEVDDEQYKRWEKCKRDFAEMQSQLANIYEGRT